MVSDLSLDLVDKIKNGPAAVAPPGITPNYTNPPNNNGLANGVIGASVVVVVLVSLLRFYSKVFCVRKVKLEDYLGLASLPFFFAATWALRKTPQESGFFIHQWNLQVKSLEWFLYYYVLSTTLNCVTLLLTKAAILLEFSHIFVAKPHRSIFYWVCYGMIIANTALYITTILVITFACNPRERLWQPYLPGSCIDLDAFNIFIATFHLVFDILMLLLPQTVIWKLALTKKQKFGLSVVFSVGALACIWASGRVASAVHLSKSRDASYAYSHYVMWGLAEVVTALLVFCAPAFPAVFRESSPPRRFSRFLQSKTTRYSLNSVSPNGSLPKPPPTKVPRALSGWRSTRSDNDSSVSLAKLAPVKIESGRKFDEESLGPVPGGILISTEINIESHGTSNSKGSQAILEGTPPAW
ncbi:hypothetical protein F4782DRAFT_529522 [Xylaria castorea]|nr:hypothetical protein F4782DRAFT_529522 [Xylaria castorea]